MKKGASAFSFPRTRESANAEALEQVPGQAVDFISTAVAKREGADRLLLRLEAGFEDSTREAESYARGRTA